jgi:phosphoribosylanthranilate isomerase
VTALVKVCGLTTPDAVAAAATADFAGFNFYPRSPRNLTPAAAGALAAALPARVRRVAITVDADDATLDAIVAALKPDFVQLHGAEGPMRAAAIRKRFGVGAIKAIAVAAPGDLAAAERYAHSVDWLMFDAKPPPRPDALPGGNAESFDWTMLAGRSFPHPWFLAGGLDAGNVAAAIAGSGAPAVDVSSGVEAAPGRKDPAKIAAFLAAARGAA